MEYYLKLKFRNAGFMPNHERDKDYFFDNGGRNERCKQKIFKEPITKYQVSNILHVLCGERPSASLRKTLINPIPAIQLIAENSWLKINPYTRISKEGKEYPIKETISGKKILRNSNVKQENITWSSIKRYLATDFEVYSNQNPLYDFFVSEIEKITKINNITEKFTALDFFIYFKQNHEMLNKKEYDIMMNFIRKEKSCMIGKKSPLEKMFDLEETTKINESKNTYLTYNNCVVEKVNISGSIIIKINDYIIEKIKNGTGFTTILDGGMLEIEDLISESEFITYSELEGFTQILDISIEKI